MLFRFFFLGLFRVTVGFDLVHKYLGFLEKVPPHTCCLGLFSVTVGFDVAPKHLGYKKIPLPYVVGALV